MCLAKANSYAILDEVVFQELSLGEGQAVENGDSLEVAYTGWLMQNHTIGQVTPPHHCFSNFIALSIVLVDFLNTIAQSSLFLHVFSDV